MVLPNNVTNPGEKSPIHTTVFANRNRQTEQAKGGTWATVGYVNPDGNRPVSQEYLIGISSIRNRCTVVCPIQEPIRKKVESAWEPFIPSSILKEGNILVQAASGGRKALMSRAVTRRMWVGTSPMSLSLNLKFNAVSDPFHEVLEPIRLLESIAMPSEPAGRKALNVGSAWNAAKSFFTADLEAAKSNVQTFANSIPLVYPPGPTPFTIDGIIDLGEAGSTSNRRREDKLREGLNGGDIIVVEIGRFLTFYNVIVRSVSSETPVMFDRNGDPISSSANIEFETYEMITTEELSRMYTKNILGGQNE